MVAEPPLAVFDPGHGVVEVPGFDQQHELVAAQLHAVGMLGQGLVEASGEPFPFAFRPAHRGQQAVTFGPQRRAAQRALEPGDSVLGPALGQERRDQPPDNLRLVGIDLHRVGKQVDARQARLERSLGEAVDDQRLIRRQLHRPAQGRKRQLAPVLQAVRSAP